MIKPERLERLLQLARRAPPPDSGSAPPFFARRVTARWLSAQREKRSPWEILAVRGMALSAVAVFLAVVLNESLRPGNNEEGDPDYTAEVFSLP